jgi:hypothetical protein
LADVFFRQGEGRSSGQTEKKENANDHRARWVELRRLHWSDSNRPAFAGPMPRWGRISCRLACNELRVAAEIRDPKFFPCPGFHRPIFETSGSVRSFRHAVALAKAGLLLCRFSS